MAYPVRPGSVTADLGVYTPAVPITASQEAKVSGTSIPTDAVLFDEFPAGNEMLAVDVYLRGQWANAGPITISFQWLRVEDNTIVFTHTGQVPTPASQGFGYWDWYGWRSWIGKTPTEVSGPGPYVCFIEVKDSQGVFFKEQRSIAVIGEEPPPPPPPPPPAPEEMAPPPPPPSPPMEEPKPKEGKARPDKSKAKDKGAPPSGLPPMEEAVPPPPPPAVEQPGPEPKREGKGRDDNGAPPPPDGEGGQKTKKGKDKDGPPPCPEGTAPLDDGSCAPLP